MRHWFHFGLEVSPEKRAERREGTFKQPGKKAAAREYLN
jgi:hypothetical protein